MSHKPIGALLPTRQPYLDWRIKEFETDQHGDKPAMTLRRENSRRIRRAAAYGSRLGIASYVREKTAVSDGGAFQPFKPTTEK